jgi:hypothetical protein
MEGACRSAALKKVAGRGPQSLNTFAVGLVGVAGIVVLKVATIVVARSVKFGNYEIKVDISIKGEQPSPRKEFKI